MPTLPRYFTISAAARYLGVSRPTIYSKLDAGTLTGFVNEHGLTRIPRESLLAYEASLKPTARQVMREKVARNVERTQAKAREKQAA